MLYGDLRHARDVFKKGENVTSALREQFDIKYNSPEIIEIAYDLQSGSYINAVKEKRRYWLNYTTEISNVLHKYCIDAESILDVGTGEMTTLAGVANKFYNETSDYYACDISWSRLIRGVGFLAEELSESVFRKITPFVANLFQLPFVDGAIDVIWTSHALEPNGGQEKVALTELLRVSRRKLILFEPYYEGNSSEGRQRMDRLGYVKNIPQIIKECGATCDEIIPLKNISNPLNPTYAFVVTPPVKLINKEADLLWACPATQFPLSRVGDCFWSEYSMFAYPILQGIPILRPESAILASALEG
ncbi:hypothetical protein SAMN05660420_00163 [Desulfuromusa kysingii]|uniref:Methyltransferase domain-containing protein n=1 Tax=Desulfuromusa kysingii TaxID=37625 RepID=A0A1H3VML3_9BACT|nr:hypothetical protein [Desulfuromusa kysingii]SDZ75989.1 hypothetical protein SAMN05660420_00163 [Desulfuromusa kysingii]